MAAFLLGARLAGLTSGTHALFFMDVFGSFSIDRLMKSTTPDDVTNVTVDDDSSLLQEAVQALFIIRSSPTSGLQHSLNDTDPPQTYRDMRNAVFLLAVSLREAETLGLNVTSGRAVTSSTANLTFAGSGGEVGTNANGEMKSFFVVYDYDPQSAVFRAVLEVASSTFVLTLSGAAVWWPNGVGPEPDTCDFVDCDSTGMTGVVIATTVIVCLMLVPVAVAVIFVVRRRMILKEMEKGPNKILLTVEDLTFVSPKSSFKSQSIFDKPDLLKASEPSLSLHSFNNEFGEYTNVARYNGDMVYVKELKIKNFEIKGKVRKFIKALRDLRHENINPFIGCFIDPLRPSLVSEWCQRRSLEDVLSNETIKLDWDFKLSLMTDLVRGMRYLHASPIRQHGNLKSGNCVIDSRWVLKITDYGLGGMYERYETSREQKSRDLLWTAPEVLRDPVLLGNGTQKGDVYSFGIILQEIIIRGHPFCMLELDTEEIIKKIKKPPPLCRPSVSQQMAPPSYIQIMKQCWSEMIDMRPEFDQINQQFKDLNKGKKVNVVDTMFKMLEKYSNDLEDIVRVRTNELEEEKKKTENLLAQMLPASVAVSLMTGKPVEAESFKEVTIYFSDIVGFTTISALSTPMQVVALLNDLYTMFDGTIENHDVYKVETIGDAYMVVSGLPERNGNRHAGEVAAMALNLLIQCGSFKIRHMPNIPMMLRSGLHTGPCVAGVVGLRMPRYCLFGDTVNTASRMESTGLAYRIHVSGEVKKILDELGGYKLDCRGEVELKGKGLAKTYWLIGMDGWDHPLPEPPKASGPDNHGLGAYIDADTLDAAAKQKELAEKGELEVEQLKDQQQNPQPTSDAKPEVAGMEPEVETTTGTDGAKDSAAVTAPPEGHAKLENGGQTVVAEINHMNETLGDDSADTLRKASVLKQEDTSIGDKQTDALTAVEEVVGREGEKF